MNHEIRLEEYHHIHAALQLTMLHVVSIKSLLVDCHHLLELNHQVKIFDEHLDLDLYLKLEFDMF